MAPLIASSTSTSLLWAHQLKREHGFLLQRMQELEAKTQDQEARIATAESAKKSNSNGEIEELAAQVKALNEAGANKRLEDMERDVAQKLDDVQAESEAHTLQIASIQENEKMAEDERRKSAGKGAALLKRIGEVEDGLQKYENSLGRMGKRLDETRFEQIKGQLDGLTKQVQREGEQMKWLSESITALEAANTELKKANEKLETELAKMAAKAASAEKTRKSEKSSAVNAETAQAAGGADEGTPKKKSHKWSGGGADMAIIRQGANLFGSPNTVHKSHTVSKEPPTKRPAPPGPKKKQQPPQIKPHRVNPNESSETPKKSHRWHGGGADKDIIVMGVSNSIDSKRRRSTDNVQESTTSTKKPHESTKGVANQQITQAGSPAAPNTKLNQPDETVEKKPRRSYGIPEPIGDEKFIRAGKGWIEVIEPQSAEPNASTSAPPVKRKRGRPRKEHITPQWTDKDLLTQGRVTRRGVHQTQEQPPTKKRTADSAFGADDDTEETLKRIRRIKREESPEVNMNDIVWSSQGTSQPLASTAYTTTANGFKEDVRKTVTFQSEALPKPRRQIIQPDMSHR